MLGFNRLLFFFFLSPAWSLLFRNSQLISHMEVHVLPNFLSFIQFLSSTVEQLYFLNVSTDFVFPTVLENLTHLVFKMRP